MTAPSIREALERLLMAAKLLQQNAKDCAVNHHGVDFEQQGMPGWLRDTKADIDTAQSALAAPPQDVVEGIARIVTSEMEQMHKDGVPMCMREGETTWRTYHAGFDLSMFAQRITTAILASGLVTEAANNGDLNVANSPLYSKALNSLRTAHEACFRSADRDVLGMSKGPFSGVNLALGIIKNLEEKNTILKAAVLRAGSAIRADERERCARVLDRRVDSEESAAERHKQGARHYKAREAMHVARIAMSDAAAIRAGGAK